jgi:hypothetical protein
MTADDVVEGISLVRYDFLRDSTPFNFCELPDLFGPNGRLTVSSKRPAPLHRTTQECANAPRDRRLVPRVSVRSQRIVGDTVVFEGYTDRGWVTLLEEYRFHRPQGVHSWLPTYRIVGFIEQ